MCDTGRQVQHIAIAHLYGVAGFKLTKQRKILTGIGVVGDIVNRKSPVANTDSLTKKNVVIIPMWTDASTGRCETDHQVIDSPVRNEGNVLE